MNVTGHDENLGTVLKYHLLFLIIHIFHVFSILILREHIEVFEEIAFYFKRNEKDIPLCIPGTGHLPGFKMLKSVFNKANNI